MKNYTSKEICDMFKISPPRLLQFRKGQSVVVKSKNPSKPDRVYNFDPLLEEGLDWYWDGSEVVFRQSTIAKLSKRKQYNKSGNYTAQALQRTMQQKKAKQKLKDGEYSVQDIADKYKLTVQKVYALRDISTNRPVSYKDYLIQNKDWKYDDGKVILFESAKKKIKGYAELIKEKEQVPKAKRIAILVGTKLFHLTGNEAQMVISIIQSKQKKREDKDSK